MYIIVYQDIAFPLGIIVDLITSFLKIGIIHLLILQSYIFLLFSFLNFTTSQSYGSNKNLRLYNFKGRGYDYDYLEKKH